jgi:excisionase family DNA binding protein
MASIGRALVDDLDGETLDRLADVLAPRIAARLPAPAEPSVPLLTCAQAAVLCCVHVETIRRAVRSGALHACRNGRVVRIAESDLTTWLRRTDQASNTQQRVTQPRRPRARHRPLASALRTNHKENST